MTIENPYKNQKAVHSNTFDVDWVYLGTAEAIHDGDELPDDLWCYSCKPLIMRAWSRTRGEYNYLYADPEISKTDHNYPWRTPWGPHTQFDPYFQVAYERAKAYGYKLP